MALDDILAGIGGALEGGLASYSWQKQMQQEDRLLNEREMTRRDQNNARSLDMMLRERGYIDDQEERTREAAAMKQKQQIFDEWYAALPSEMQKVVRAKQFGVNADAEDFEDPAAKDLRLKDAEGKKYLDEELKHTRAMETTGASSAATFERQKKIEELRHQYRLQEKPDPPVTPKDDPALPMGVRDYLSSLLEKHDGDFEAAESEWNQGFTEQQTKHPRLDPGRARTYLQEVFDYQRPKADPAVEAVERLRRMEPNAAPPVTPRARGFGPAGNRSPDGPSAAGAPRLDVSQTLGLTPRVSATDVAALKDSVTSGAQPRVGTRPSGDFLRELREGTGRPGTEVVEVMEPPSDDPPQERSPEAAGDQMQRLEAQAKSLFQQWQREADPARKAALGAQVQRLRAQYEAAKRKGP